MSRRRLGERDDRHGADALGTDPLARAVRVTDAAARLGFDWPAAEPVYDKIHEELAELRAAVATDGIGAKTVEAELGDLLFSVVNLARHLRVDPAGGLDGTSERFEQRFEYIEDRLAERDLAPADVELDELDRLWDEAKRAQRAAHGGEP